MARRTLAPGVYVEFDKHGSAIGVEITSARWISDGRPTEAAQEA